MGTKQFNEFAEELEIKAQPEPEDLLVLLDTEEGSPFGVKKVNAGDIMSGSTIVAKLVGIVNENDKLPASAIRDLPNSGSRISSSTFEIGEAYDEITGVTNSGPLLVNIQSLSFFGTIATYGLQLDGESILANNGTAIASAYCFPSGEFLKVGVYENETVTELRVDYGASSEGDGFRLSVIVNYD